MMGMAPEKKKQGKKQETKQEALVGSVTFVRATPIPQWCATVKFMFPIYQYLPKADIPPRSQIYPWCIQLVLRSRIRARC